MRSQYFFKVEAEKIFLLFASLPKSPSYTFKITRLSLKVQDPLELLISINLIFEELRINIVQSLIPV